MPRIFTVHTPLGPEMLKFESLQGRERLSQLFEFRLDMLSPSQDISAEALLGHNVTVEVETQGLGRRYLNGEVTSFGLVSRLERHYRYQAVVRPWTWYMTRTENSKIFQNKTAIDMILEVLFYPYGNVSSWGVLNRTTDSYRKWDYCVQYQESDFNFVSRMMEHEGIYYFFKHEMGKHTLVLADSPAGHDALPEYAKVPYIGRDAASIADEEHFDGWMPSKQVESGAYLTDDYDFTKPRAKLEQRKTHPLGHPNDRYRVYQYPGGYTEPTPDGEFYTKVRLEALQSPHEILIGDTGVRGIAPGYHFNLYRCPRADQNREYLIVGADYDWKENPYDATGRTPTVHRARVTCQDYAVQFRPARVTPKPRTHGPQTAVVVGPKGEEIWTDGYGRVKVQFRWDREGKHDENSSCWMRVSHPWAGTNFGAIHIPRIGQEVIVDFIGGDPDYPIITGRVYNADEMPPWTLPAHKTQSGILTRSTPKGTPDHANMIRFEDRKGAEQIRVHAERNLVTSVEADEFRAVGHDRTTRIGHDDAMRVGGDQSLKVDGNETIQIGANEKIDIGGNLSLHVASERSDVVDSNYKLEVGRSLVIEANSIVLKGSGGWIGISPEGITIEGNMVFVNCGAAMKAQLTMIYEQVSAALLQLKAQVLQEPQGMEAIGKMMEQFLQDNPDFGKGG
jgi:type VI secretion system secreted protein VgrG